MIDFQSFCNLAQQGNFIPVYTQWVADLETPVSAWYKVCSSEQYSFLLESVEGGENIGRYSFLGCDPLWILETKKNITTQIFRDGTISPFWDDPFKVLAECVAPYHPVKVPELPPGIGGLFGIWNYELIRWIEPTVPIYPNLDDLPDGIWMQIDQMLVFDQVKRKIWAIAYADLRVDDLQLAYEKAIAKVEKLINRLKNPLTDEQTFLAWNPPSLDKSLSYDSNTSREQFMANVERAKDYIKAGDIFQVVISQQLSTVYQGDPFCLYRSLRLINPSPYMAYFQFDKLQLIGSSPEVLVRLNRDPITNKMMANVRPIAGTRPRGKTQVEDLAFAQELLKDPKELAEHIMLVDLGRNDLGRVCVPGTVSVDELMVIERYSHVMHIVSNVVGELLEDKTAWDLLKACFPAGTVSGAPKIRAMQIINELEGTRRGPYSGAYGYYDFEGQLNTAIAIRTMIVIPLGEGKYRVSVQAGAGLVADSIPESEYQETLNKAKGALEAIRCLQHD